MKVLILETAVSAYVVEDAPNCHEAIAVHRRGQSTPIFSNRASLTATPYDPAAESTQPRATPSSPAPQIPYPNAGPGTELGKLLDRFGFKPAAGCNCKKHIVEMNANGPQWCADNIDTILGWLREEAQRAGYPFTELGAKLLILRAISNSKRLTPAPSSPQT